MSITSTFEKDREFRFTQNGISVLLHAMVQLCNLLRHVSY
jgi:hypothetical protein